eukprot:TRINITY_DN18497_c0_g2_i1.p1 TRINITY_DN18497_c0_g2~~TRINITY_DN18497_c0_g2_i1.p1  ORF type:complete len:526 (-),score=109.21 TRINITY_DN18497_c0_g2_i1:51-1628(-)
MASLARRRTAVLSALAGAAQAARILHSGAAPRVIACTQDTYADCIANAVEMAVHLAYAGGDEAEMQAEEYSVEVQTNVSKKISVKQLKPMPADAKSVLMTYSQMSENKWTMILPGNDETWTMEDAKHNGGKSKEKLYKSRNSKLWLKTLSTKDLRVWEKMRDSYIEHLTGEKDEFGTPTSFLARVLGLFEAEGQAWLVALGVGAAARTYDAEKLRCDIKPHQLSSVPKSYENLEKCGRLVHDGAGPLQSGDQVRLKAYLRAAKRDICWLSSWNIIDFSWLISEASPNDAGAIRLGSQWFHVGLVDYLMEYSTTRWMESNYKAYISPAELPNASHAEWASPEMYSSGKFDKFPAKQLGVFEAIANACPAAGGLEEKALNCAKQDIDATTDDASLEALHCSREELPFEVPAGGLAQKYRKERQEVCVREVQDVMLSIYNQFSYIVGPITNSVERVAAISHQLETALPWQMKQLAVAFQTRGMQRVECIWTGNNGRPNTDLCRRTGGYTWFAQGCLVLNETAKGMRSQ